MYTYPFTPAEEWEDRGVQFVNFGVPQATVDTLKSKITDMWIEGAGGWVYEWSAIAADYAAKSDHTMASLVYGFAKFPTVCDQQRVVALQKQVDEFIKAAPTFPVHFERRTMTLPYAGSTVDFPVHIYSADANYAERPVMLMSGGVDTFKIEFHQSYIAAVQQLGATVVAFDMPGTAEMRHVPLNGAADEVVLGLVKEARKLGNGIVGYHAFSFGGNFSALVGLTGVVDMCVDNGGPVNGAFTAEHISKVPFGMGDIVGNAMGFTYKPSVEELVQVAQTLSRAKLFDLKKNSPMYVINGADDYFVPVEDSTIFQSLPNTEVHIIPGTGHCCISKLSEIYPMMYSWLRSQLDAKTAEEKSA